jgi:hypothetical protein
MTIIDHPDNHDREWAYRRGYAHGAAAVIAALRTHLPERIRDQTEDWLSDDVEPWACVEMRLTRPPEFPRLDRQVVSQFEIRGA